MIHWGHILVQMVHDPDRATDDEKDDQKTEGPHQNVIRIIRSRRDMQKEHQIRTDPAKAIRIESWFNTSIAAQRSLQSVARP